MYFHGAKVLAAHRTADLLGDPTPEILVLGTVYQARVRPFSASKVDTISL